MGPLRNHLGFCGSILVIAALALALHAGWVWGGTIADGSITVSSSAAGFSTVSDDATRGLITVETGAVRVGFKTAPTSTTGILLYPGDSMTIVGQHDLQAFNVILNSGESSATVRYIMTDGSER